ncbi:hypothetical protein DSECCO2_426130 [anaerobic digester metagenome]
MKLGVSPTIVSTTSSPRRMVQSSEVYGPVEVETNWTASGATPVFVSIVKSATIGTSGVGVTVTGASATLIWTSFAAEEPAAFVAIRKAIFRPGVVKVTDGF